MLKMCQEHPKYWEWYLLAVLLAYREVPQASTGFSPFELFYGRTVRGPMQVLRELWTNSEASLQKIKKSVTQNNLKTHNISPVTF